VATAALIVSLVALGAAAVSVWYTHRADQRGERADWREERRDAKADRQAAEVAEREAAQRRAHLVVSDAGSEGGPTHPMQKLHFTVYNSGPAAASNIALWLSEDTHRPVGISTEVDGLQSGERSERMTVEFNGPSQAGRALNVIVTWSDGEGRHNQVSQTRMV
jgi:hypothetical protein